MERVFNDGGQGYETLGAQVASGSAAVLYASVGDPTKLVKIMKDGEVPPNAEFIWKTIRASCKGIIGVAQMGGFVRKHPGTDVLGYVTEYVPGPELNDFKFTDPGEARRASAEVAETYSVFDERDTYPGDAHYCNQIVTGALGKRTLKLIDVDSFSFGPRRHPDGTLAARHYQNQGPGFGPPEHSTGATITHCPATSAYKLAEIVYRVLKHHHPAEVATTAGATLPLLNTVARKLYGRFEPDELKRQSRVAIDEGVAWAELPRDLRRLLMTTFGKRNVPAARPSCRDLYECLADYADLCPRRNRVRLNLPRLGRKTLIGAGLGAALVTGAAIGFALKTTPQPSPAQPTNTTRPALWDRK